MKKREPAMSTLNVRKTWMFWQTVVVCWAVGGCKEPEIERDDTSSTAMMEDSKLSEEDNIEDNFGRIGCLERPGQQKAGCNLNSTITVWTGTLNNAHIWLPQHCYVDGSRVPCCSPDIPDWELEIAFPNGIAPGDYTIGQDGITAKFLYVWDHKREPTTKIEQCECSTLYTRSDLPIESGTFRFWRSGEKWLGKLEGLEPWVLPIVMDMTPCEAVLGG